MSLALREFIVQEDFFGGLFVVYDKINLDEETNRRNT